MGEKARYHGRCGGLRRVSHDPLLAHDNDLLPKVALCSGASAGPGGGVNLRAAPGALHAARAMQPTNPGREVAPLMRHQMQTEAGRNRLRMETVGFAGLNPAVCTKQDPAHLSTMCSSGDIMQRRCPGMGRPQRVTANDARSAKAGQDCNAAQEAG